MFVAAKIDTGCDNYGHINPAKRNVSLLQNEM